MPPSVHPGQKRARLEKAYSNYQPCKARLQSTVQKSPRMLKFVYAFRSSRDHSEIQLRFKYQQK